MSFRFYKKNINNNISSEFHVKLGIKYSCYTYVICIKYQRSENVSFANLNESYKIIEKQLILNEIGIYIIPWEKGNLLIFFLRALKKL